MAEHEKVYYGEGHYTHEQIEEIIQTTEARVVEECCAAVCGLCREGREHPVSYDLYKCAPIRRAQAERVEGGERMVSRLDTLRTTNEKLVEALREIDRIGVGTCQAIAREALASLQTEAGEGGVE